MTFFDRVKTLVKEQNKTIDGLMKTSFGQDSSRDIFNGWQRRKVLPRADDLLKISKTLNVSMEYLITGEFYNYPKNTPRIQSIANPHLELGKMANKMHSGYKVKTL